MLNIKNHSKNPFVQRLSLVSISKIIIMLGSIILLPILTKTLPTAEYAIWVQVMVLTGIMLPIAEMGLSTAMLRFFPTENNKTELGDKFHTILFFTLITSVIISSILFLAEQQVANYLFGGWGKVIYFVAVLFPIMVINNTCMSYFRARQQIKNLSIFTIVQSILIMGLVGLVVLSYHDIFQALAAYTFAQLLMFFMMFGLICREIGIGTPNLSYLIEYLRFGLPALPQTIAMWAITGSDRFLIGLFIGITYVGYYSPAYGLGSSVMLFMAPLGTLLPAALSELQDSGREAEMWKRVNQSATAFLILSIPAGIVISIFAKPILELLTTQEIASNSYIIVPLIVMASIQYGFQAILSNILIVKKKMATLAGITIISAVVCVVTNLTLIPYLGLLGAAASLQLTYTAMTLLTAHQTFKAYKESKQAAVV